MKGLWTAAAVWIKEGPGVGRAVAEWMTHGYSEIDVSHSDIARFHPHQKRREHTRPRTTESFIKTYGIIHPAEQYESDRDQRLPPMYDSQQKLGAVFFETAGWERPHWYESNAGLLEQYGDARDAARARVGLALVDPDHQRRAPADARGRRRHRPHGVPDLRHRRARVRSTTVQRTCVAQCDVAVGKVIYTPVLDAHGGFRSDLTVMRLGDDHFRVVTGGAHGMADRKWFADLLPSTAATLDRPHRRALDHRPLGSAGPRHPRLAHRRRRLRRGLRLPHLPGDRGRRRDGARLPHLLRRRARLGALRLDGRRGRSSGRRCSTPATTHGTVPVGIGVYGTTGRIEKGYRAYGYELDGERTIVEAGMQRPKVKAADFVGREAYVAQREESRRRRCSAR